jgi:membrane protease YdiL (CAAX protease family)
LKLIALVLAALAGAVVLAPGVAWLLPTLVGKTFTFARVFDRVFQVLLVVGLVLAWRRLDLGGLAQLGLGRSGWARGLGRGLALGFAGLGVGLAFAWLCGGLRWELRYDPPKTVRKAALGAGAAVLLGAGEEILFRGVLLRRLTVDAGVAAGVAVTTGIYAVVHVMRGRGGPAPVGPGAGITRVEAMIAPLTTGAALPEIAGLALLGALLAAARLRTGSLWPAIGIHAAWVAVFRIGRLFFTTTGGPAWLVGAGWPPMVGGATAWVAVAVSALLLPRLLRR